tara:strand:+ start:1080 stop:1400 length:321 start_codon:yes stop_codon:yes gene_type:complete
MSTKNQKNPLEWMNIAKFVIFCVSCIAAVMIWFFAQQDKASHEISQNYVNKYEMHLVQKEIEILKLEMRDFKLNFNTQISQLELANDSILELITDIRLTLAERKND